MGWLKYFSDKPEERSLFLERAAWVTASGELEEIHGAGIFLTQHCGISSVMFLNAGGESTAHTHTPKT